MTHPPQNLHIKTKTTEKNTTIGTIRQNGSQKVGVCSSVKSKKNKNLPAAVKLEGFWSKLWP